MKIVKTVPADKARLTVKAPATFEDLIRMAGEHAQQGWDVRWDRDPQNSFTIMAPGSRYSGTSYAIVPTISRSEKPSSGGKRDVKKRPRSRKPALA
jgi:hypothetical protein